MMLLAWLMPLLVLGASWDDYWSCMEPCWAEVTACYEPCDAGYRGCQSQCEAQRAQRQRLADLARYRRCSTGPGRTWRQCRDLPFPASDPDDMYPDTVEVCREALPQECQGCDADGDLDVDLADWAVMTR